MTRASTPDASTVTLFQQHWRVYRIMVEENFLFHREVYARLAAYHGIDLAPEAPAVAQKALGSLTCSVSLETGDYTDLLRHRRDPADVVWIGLSLHHNRYEAKEEVLKDIRRISVPGGVLLFYENTSPDRESRDEWLARWDLQRPAWTAYTDADWDLMRDHVSAADFPETCSDWWRLAHATDFHEVQELFAAPTNLFRMYAFR